MSVHTNVRVWPLTVVNITYFFGRLPGLHQTTRYKQITVKVRIIIYIMQTCNRYFLSLQ